MFTKEDFVQMEEHGLTPAALETQLKNFREGFPFLPVTRAASCGDGIRVLDAAGIEQAAARYDRAKESLRVVKFVPASGAATRMFKELFEFVNEGKRGKGIDTLLDNIGRFAFWPELKAVLPPDADDKATVRAIVKDGLGYGQKPKGLVTFHAYPEGARKAVEEHLVEGAVYAAARGVARIHFTVSPEHIAGFETLLAEKVPVYERRFGIRYDISFSVQKPSTDTIAVNPDNTPFRQDDGTLLFRPAGHGALVENLNEIDADLVFIKNIDNVVPDKLKGDTVLYKKLIAGVLITLQQQAFAYLQLLDSGKYTHEQVLDILQFVQKKLFCKNPETKNLEDAELVIYLKEKLNRPMRVCGMVKNVGEPGGGPFLAYNSDGTISLQILESSQIDMNDPEKKDMFEKGTHFNPVDLVCAVRDYKGHKFDLVKYVDKATGFISYKSKNGKDLKALELPGLWNGAMSDWNTVFVEVPLTTFNPVKTVNDLLREQHQ